MDTRDRKKNENAMSERTDEISTKKEGLVNPKKFLRDLGIRTLAVAIWDGIKWFGKELLG